jgi:hypothetical protein
MKLGRPDDGTSLRFMKLTRLRCPTTHLAIILLPVNEYVRPTFAPAGCIPPHNQCPRGRKPPPAHQRGLFFLLEAESADRGAGLEPAKPSYDEPETVASDGSEHDRYPKHPKRLAPGHCRST